MAIHYYDEFPTRFSSRNFGDDINPFLLAKLFDPSILASEDICILGVGSILNRRNVKLVESYSTKVVFSSGAGYGQIATDLDESWDFTCVRGPNTAAAMGLETSVGVCDGAVLLADYFKPLPGRQRDNVVFIPHIQTHFAAGRVLATISSELDWHYLTPDLPMEDFILGVQYASMVITEAMHGAILADAMRVPWIPVAMHQHNEFKWRDWFLSVEQEYLCNRVEPVLWNPCERSLRTQLKKPYQRWKMDRLRKALSSMQNCKPILSNDEVLQSKRQKLLEKVDYINERYSL